MAVSKSVLASQLQQAWYAGGRNALHLNRLQLRSGRIHAQQDDAANTSRDQRPQDGSKRAPKPRYIPEWNSVDIAEGEALEAALADAEAAVQPAADGVANQIREQLQPEAAQIATQLEASDSPGFSSPLPRPPPESSPAAANTTSQQATATRSRANATQPTSKHPLPHDDPQPRTQHKTPTPSSTAPTRDNAPPAVARDSTPTPASEPVFPALGVNPRPPSASASSSSQSPFFPSLGRASAGLPSSASLDFSTPAQPGPTPDPPSPSARQNSSASSSASAAATAGSVSSAAMRFRSLAQTTRNDQPAYRPRSALSLARRRMIGKYLPFSWQRQLRRRAENIPEQQFTYLLSTIVIVGTAAASGAAAYTLWPYARTVINFIFSADAVEARVLQVCLNLRPALFPLHCTSVLCLHSAAAVRAAGPLQACTWAIRHVCDVTRGRRRCREGDVGLTAARRSSRAGAAALPAALTPEQAAAPSAVEGRSHRASQHESLNMPAGVCRS